MRRVHANYPAASATMCEDCLRHNSPATPNAKTHLPPEAAATQERRLKAVRCSAVFGWGCSVGPPTVRPLPRDAVPMGGLPEAPVTPRADARHTPT